MRVLTAASLTSGNLLYREPALHDELQDGATVVDDILHAVDQTGVRVRSVLDLGCGTGVVLGRLRQRRGWAGTGVDLQPALVDHARNRHPTVDFHVADLRGIRLGHRFDLVLCLGNTLSYMHSDAELAAAYDTVAAHSHPETLTLICTLTEPAGNTESVSQLRTAAAGSAQVNTTTRWNPADSTLTTERHWRFDSGRTETDHITRRVWDPATLHEDAVRRELRPPVLLRP